MGNRNMNFLIKAAIPSCHDLPLNYRTQQANILKETDRETLNALANELMQTKNPREQKYLPITRRTRYIWNLSTDSFRKVSITPRK
jgi:hypothetical protein